MGMGDFNLTIETEIIEALTKEKEIEKALLLALENVKKDYPFATLEMVRRTYEDVMYD